jgi:hypothetical protein
MHDLAIQDFGQLIKPLNETAVALTVTQDAVQGLDKSAKCCGGQRPRFFQALGPFNVSVFKHDSPFTRRAKR